MAIVPVGDVMSAKFAVRVIFAVTLATVSGLVVVVMNPPVPVQFTNWYPVFALAVTAEVLPPLVIAV